MFLRKQKPMEIKGQWMSAQLLKRLTDNSPAAGYLAAALYVFLIITDFN